MNGREEYTTIQAKLAQWVEVATPEQKQKIVDAVQGAVNMAESCGKAFTSMMLRNKGAIPKALALRVDMPPNAMPLLNAYIQYGQAAGALMSSLDAMKQNPDIMASPFIAAFVVRFCDEIGQSYDPFEVLASYQKEKEKPKRRATAKKALSSRKDRKATPVLKAFVMKLYHQGPFGGGPWRDLPTAARAIEMKVNARAAELGWSRKKTKYSYQVIQGWIEESLVPTE